MIRPRFAVTAALLLMGLALPSARCSGAARYNLTDLGVTTHIGSDMDPIPTSDVISLTPSGQIVYGQDRTRAGDYRIINHDGTVGFDRTTMATLVGPGGASWTIPDPGHTADWAFAVNAAGEAVGSSFFSGDKLGIPLSFTPTGGVTLLPTLPSSFGAALAVNDAGLIVGAANYGGNDYRAMLIDRQVATDLNTLIPAASGLTLVSASGVDDAGHIVGQAVDSQGRLHDYQLTPTVPEPTTLWPLMIGVAWVIRRARSRATG